MRALGYGICAALLVQTSSGCSRHATVAFPRAQAVSPAEPTWGETAGGLQCRLRPIKRVYASGDSPAFTVDLRNQGTRIFAFRQDQQAPLSAYCIDGHRRPWPQPVPRDGKVRAFGPGVEFADMPVTLPPEARSLLPPGRHVVRLAFSFEGVDVVSNPVEIEVVGSH